MFLPILELHTLVKHTTHFSPSDPSKCTSWFLLFINIIETVVLFITGLSKDNKKDFNLNQMVPKHI